MAIKKNGESVYGLRLWENEDLVPRPDDTFQERLYYVRWLETYTDTNGKKIEKIRRHYCAATEDDLAREQQVLTLLKERFSEWQGKGFIPSRKIQRGGDKTEEPIRTRGWRSQEDVAGGMVILKHVYASKYVGIVSPVILVLLLSTNSLPKLTFDSE